MSWLVGLLLVSVLAFCLTQSAHANTKIEQPSRAFGYFIGDILVQRINLSAEETTILEPDLETGQRIGPFLYRMPSQIVHQAQTRWLELRYQIINVPPSAETISLPALSIKTESGDELAVEAWQFIVSPLSSHENSRNENSLPILPDRSPLGLIKHHDNTALMASLAALLITLMLWLAWWIFRHVRDSHTLPFAKAKRTIRRLPKVQNNSDSESDAWIALHHAFNSTAGKTISTDSVNDLLTIAPWLVPFQAAIADFYAASAARFFQQSDTFQEMDVSVEALCDALYRLEKQQAKSAL